MYWQGDEDQSGEFWWIPGNTTAICSLAEGMVYLAEGVPPTQPNIKTYVPPRSCFTKSSLQSTDFPYKLPEACSY